MTKKWSKDCEWDKSKPEQRFEEKLAENGFEIVGVKIYQSKTDYLISKGGVEETFSIHGVDNNGKRGEECFEFFNKMYLMKVELMRLREEAK